jgi:1,4-dihydroxy-2-naphthoate octaprenyltransferase
VTSTSDDRTSLTTPRRTAPGRPGAHRRLRGVPSQITPAQARDSVFAPASAPVRVESRLLSYARLAKLDVYDYYLGMVVVLSAVVLPFGAFHASTLRTLALFMVGEVLVVVAMVALDDLTGFRDGSDVANYGPDAPARRKLRKPLVAGTLQPRDALRFGWLTAIAGAAVWAATVLTAQHAPVWTVVLVVVTFVFAVQYSYGVKLSYHGCQELFLAALGWALVLAPYGLVTGRFDGFVLVQALLFGMGPLLFGVYSNTNDIAGDRAVGRLTVAAQVSPRGNALFIGVLSAAEFLVGLVASLTGVAPWWFVLLMLPVTALRVRQYHVGFGERDILRARRIGIRTHRVCVVLLVVANVVVGIAA